MVTFKFSIFPPGNRTVGISLLSFALFPPWFSVLLSQNHGRSHFFPQVLGQIKVRWERSPRSRKEEDLGCGVMRKWEHVIWLLLYVNHQCLKTVTYYSWQVCALPGGRSIWIRFVWGVSAPHVSHPLPGTNRLGCPSCSDDGDTEKPSSTTHRLLKPLLCHICWHPNGQSKSSWVWSYTSPTGGRHSQIIRQRAEKGEELEPLMQSTQGATLLWVTRERTQPSWESRKTENCSASVKSGPENVCLSHQEIPIHILAVVTSVLWLQEITTHILAEALVTSVVFILIQSVSS